MSTPPGIVSDDGRNIVSMNIGTFAVSYRPMDFLGKFTENGGRVVAVQFINPETMQMVVIDRGGSIQRVPSMWGRLYDTDPTEAEKPAAWWRETCARIENERDRAEEALAAAEAECAQWRQDAGRQIKGGGWGVGDPYWGDPDPLEAADVNDATRARLGLKPIGEAKE